MKKYEKIITVMKVPCWLSLFWKFIWLMKGHYCAKRFWRRWNYLADMKMFYCNRIHSTEKCSLLRWKSLPEIKCMILMKTYYSDERLSLSSKLINIMRDSYHYYECLLIWWNSITIRKVWWKSLADLSLWWKLIILMKIYHIDEMLSLAKKALSYTISSLWWIVIIFMVV